jgi:osmotically-inducible protein OsmY
MKLIASTLIVAGALLGAGAFAQDADMDRSHPKAFVKDSVITTKIKSKLVVWLSGSAPSQDVADRAIRIAKATDGVVNVKSHIDVRPE